jgi:hypothetical protein
MTRLRAWKTPENWHENEKAAGETFTSRRIIERRRANCKSVEIRSLEARASEWSISFRCRRALDGAKALVPPIASPGPSLHSELSHYVLNVFFDRSRAKAKDGSYLGIAFAGGDPFEDFAFAQAQGMEGR